MTLPIYQRSKDAIFSNIGDDVVALNVRHGTCYGMENAAAEVWNLLTEPSNAEQICNRLIERFDVEPDVCRSDVSTLLQQLQSEGLIEQTGAAT